MKNTIKDLISIIVPMFNVEKYIEKCIFSLKEQTYKNFEVIIVDDGSKDESYYFANRAIDGDNRFRVFSKENGGLSSARNYGIKFAKGEFITFIDSDDYVCKEYLMHLYSAIRKNNECDISMSRIRYTAEKEKNNDNITKKYSIETVKNDIAMKKMFLRDMFNHCAYGKLYKSYIWDNSSFPEGRLYEDYLTTYKIFMKSTKIALIDSEDYFYVQHKGSIMHDKVSLQTLDIINVSNEVTEWVKMNSFSLFLPALELQLATYMKTLHKIRSYDKTSFMDIQHKLEKYLKKKSIKVLFYKNTPVRDRLKILLFFINKHLFYVFYSLFGNKV